MSSSDKLVSYTPNRHCSALPDKASTILNLGFPFSLAVLFSFDKSHEKGDLFSLDNYCLNVNTCEDQGCVKSRP